MGHEGFVLHQRAYRETSAIAELFTREHGRVGAVARGVRARRSRGAALLPFCRYWFDWRGRGELVTLTEWEVQGAAARLEGTALVSGLYLNELLVRLLERQDPHPELFDAYGRAVGAISVAKGRERALRIFEKSLLSGIGYGLDLDADVDGAPIRAHISYRYGPESGAVAVAAAPAASDLIRGDTLLALRDERFETREQMREAKGLMRILIQHYLQGRKLVSRTLLR